jgi:hypothetical protein
VNKILPLEREQEIIEREREREEKEAVHGGDF